MAIDWSDHIVVAHLADEPELSDELQELLRRSSELDPKRVPHMVLSLSDATYMNSSNLTQLLRLRAHLLEHNRSLVLCALHDTIWTMMLMTGLDKVLRFAPDIATGIATAQLDDSNANNAEPTDG